MKITSMVDEAFAELVNMLTDTLIASSLLAQKTRELTDYTPNHSAMLRISQFTFTF
jgi:hypothetical protein